MINKPLLVMGGPLLIEKGFIPNDNASTGFKPKEPRHYHVVNYRRLSTEVPSL
jgi:hypothetical protein